MLISISIDILDMELDLIEEEVFGGVSGGGSGQSIIIFAADMSSSKHIDKIY